MPNTDDAQQILINEGKRVFPERSSRAWLKREEKLLLETGRREEGMRSDLSSCDLVLGS